MMPIFSSKENRIRALGVLAIIVAITILIGFFSAPLLSMFKDHETLREYILGYNAFAPIVFIIIQVAQVLLAPIPGQITGFVAGYLFGWWKGTLFAMLGLALGSLIAFSLARTFGRPFVEKVLDKTVLKKFDYVSTHKGPFTLFMFFLLPAFPDDALCFIAGLSVLPIRHFMAIMILGRLPGMLLLSLTGSGVAQNDAKIAIIFLSILLIASAFGWWYRKDIEDYYHKATK